MRRLWYLWKAQAAWGWLTFLLLLGFLLFLLLKDAFHGFQKPRHLRDAALILEVFLPLVLATLLAGVPAQEREVGTAELVLTYREPAPVRLVGYLAVPVGLWALGVTGTALAIHWWYMPMTWNDLVTMALWPALGLGGAALAASSLARHQAGGMIAAALWWGIDLQAPGRLNTLAYLFNIYQPVQPLDVVAMRWGLALVAGAGLGLALWLSGRRERWVR